MKVAAFVLAVSILGVSFAEAQQAKKSAWPQEPASFLGIRFGEPLKASIDECPKNSYSGISGPVFQYAPSSIETPCFESWDDMLQIYNVDGFSDVMVNEVEGKVEMVMAFFRAEEAPEISHALIGKFGPPHYRSVEKKRNAFGTIFANRVLRWHGRNISIDFDSIGSKIDEGDVYVATRAYTASAAKGASRRKHAIQGIL